MSKQPSGYERSTLRTDAEALPPELRELVRAKALKHGIEEDPLGAGGHGIRTESTPVRKRRLLMGKLKASTVVALIAGDLLVVLTGEADEPPALLLYRLDEIDVAEFDSPLIEDTGIEITGLTRGATERHTLFIPADQGADGRWFRDELRAAIAASR